MRRFSSYGPVNTDLHFYVPRKNLIEKGLSLLTGEDSNQGGYYFTVWAPRQCGKTWIMMETVKRIKQWDNYHVAMISMEPAKTLDDEKKVLEIFLDKISETLGIEFPKINSFSDIRTIFTKKYFKKPVILIIDEFDALEDKFISGFTGLFRDIYIGRLGEPDKTSGEKTHLLHGLALIGVRSVLGIENQTGSPFNVQRSLHIPNLTFDEVKEMFIWYEKESGQKVDETIAKLLYDETLGQPGLTCWFGELLTETYNRDTKVPISMTHFKEAYGAATHLLPNNNILNLISKVNIPEYRDTVLKLFETAEKTVFNFDDKNLNFLYMNGVITEEKVGLDEYYVKFSSPFIQKRIFNNFSSQYFSHLGQLIHPLDRMSDAINDDNLNVPNIIKRYGEYLKKNRDTFFKNVPRRKTDLKICEAVYHFNIYRYLYDLLKVRGVDVIPQFPTGNGKIDLILKYREKRYAIELKSFKDMYSFEKGMEQAEIYGRQLGLEEIVYLVFVELNEEEAKQLEQVIEKQGIKIIVLSIGIL